MGREVLHCHTDHGCVGNGVVLQQDRFQLGWRDLVAFDFDEFL
jgi:hypothetical protein